MSTHDLPERLATVVELRDQAQSDDRDTAVAARASLVRLITDDSPEVSAAAQAALAETSISLIPPRIDFGPVAPGTPRLSAAITIQGAPMALTSRIKVTGAGLRARIAGGQLQVQWQPGDGSLTGMVSLDGPAGAADLPVTGHISSAQIGYEPLGAGPHETWPPDADALVTYPAATEASNGDSLGSLPADTGLFTPDPWGAETAPLVSEAERDAEAPGAESHGFEPRRDGEAEQAATGSRGDWSTIGVTVIDRDPVFPLPSDAPPKSRRRGKGLIIAGATALVLLAGTGLAAAVTLRNEQPPASAPEQAGPPPAADQQGQAAPPPAADQQGQAGSDDKGGADQGKGGDQTGNNTGVRPSLDKPTVAGTIEVGDEPEGVAVSPDSRTLYVANQSSRILSVADLQSGQVRNVTLRNTPRFVAVSQDGRRVYVSMYEDDLSGSGVAVVDARKLTVLQNLKTGVQPYALAVAPDGRLWVPIHGGRNVEIYESEKLTGRVFVPENPHAVSFDTDGQRAFTPDHESSTVSAIDTRTDKRLKSIPVSAAPHSLAVSPDGRTVVVACFQANAVDLIDTETLERRGPFKVGRKPQAAAFAVDSAHAYAVNEAGNSVSVIDPSTGAITATVPVGRSPRTMAVAPNGRFAYVSNGDDDTVTILRVS